MFKFTLSSCTLACALALATPLSITSAVANDKKQNDDNQEAEVMVIKGSKRGYIAYISASGAKDNTPVIETPASISVLTKKRIEDLGAENIQDAIGYVAGVYNGPFGVDTRSDWAFIRGARPTFHIDGMKMLFGYYNSARPNPYSFQQVEVLKGSSSLLFGQGTTAGAINLVSKQPEIEPLFEAWAQIGNYDRKQIAFDYNQGQTDSDVAFRINGLLKNSGTQTDYVSDDGYYISPSMRWLIDENSELVLIAHLQEDKTGSSTQFFPHHGTIFSAPNGPLAVNRFISEPNFDKYDTSQKALTAIYKHTLSDNWDFRGSLRWADSSSDYQSMYPTPFNLLPDNASILRALYYKDAASKILTSDLRLLGNIQGETTEHRIIIGLDIQDSKVFDSTVIGYNTIYNGQVVGYGGGALNLYNPVYGQHNILSREQLIGAYNANAPFARQLMYISETTTKAQQYGLYIQDNIKFDSGLITSLGLRYDDVSTANPTKQSDTAVTGRFGLMYQTDSQLTPYLSYSTSFNPILGKDAQGNPFKPATAKQTEMGLKYQPKNTQHLITLSVFDIKEKNRLTASVADPYNQKQLGANRIKGIELEGQFEWDELDIYTAITKSDATISESLVPGEIGTKMETTPEFMASTWFTYRPEAAWKGFKVGLGFRHVGNSFFYTDINHVNNTRTEQAVPSYQLVDLLLGYETDNYDISLNVDNVSDKTVITSCLDRGDCFYGQKRHVSLNFKYKM